MEPTMQPSTCCGFHWATCRWSLKKRWAFLDGVKTETKNCCHGWSQTRTFCTVGYTAEDSLALLGYNGRKTVSAWDTMEKKFCFIGYNRRKFVMKHPEIVLRCILHPRKISSVVSHTGKNIFRLIPQSRKPLPLYPTQGKNLKLKYCAKIKFSSKPILLMNQDPKWISLMKKIEGEKSRSTIPLNQMLC